MHRYLATRQEGTARRLLCFHHAGAGAMAFAGWRQRVGPGVTVLPVRLPGRETRLREPLITDGRLLVEELESDLGPLLDEPHAFYGHSLGALVAYRFALHRIGIGRRPPEVLLIGACPAPHLSSRLLETAARPGLTDERLVGLLTDEESMPEQLLRRPERLRTTLATLRADLRLARGLRTTPPTALPCPLWAFAGSRDPMVSVAEIRAWQLCTASRFHLRSVPGAHFFVRGRELPRTVGEVLHVEMPLPQAD